MCAGIYYHQDQYPLEPLIMNHAVMLVFLLHQELMLESWVMALAMVCSHGKML